MNMEEQTEGDGKEALDMEVKVTMKMEVSMEVAQGR